MSGDYWSAKSMKTLGKKHPKSEQPKECIEKKLQDRILVVFCEKFGGAHMQKIEIFLSHAAVDSDIANIFKEEIEKNFLGGCTVFVASSLKSIEGGGEWADSIKENLRSCSMLIGLLSPMALTRPWVFFEFGAVWAREIPTVPLCFAGVERGQLPAPISGFQALNLCDPVHIEHLYSSIAKLVGLGSPAPDFRELGEKYSYETEAKRKEIFVKENLAYLIAFNRVAFENLENADDASINVHPQKEQDIFFLGNILRENKILNITPNGFAFGTPIGAQASIFRVEKLENWHEYKKIV